MSSVTDMIKKKLSFLTILSFIFFTICENQKDSKQLESSKILSSIKENEIKETKEKESQEIVKEAQLKNPIKKEKKEDKLKDRFELNFENAALRNVLDYISDLFDVNFLPDDAITDEKKLKGINDVRVTFKTHKSFTQKQVWNFLDSILEIAGLSRIQLPGMPGNFYRITANTIANKSNLSTFFGIEPDTLPQYERIRYVYFLLNKQVAQIREVIAKFLSKNAQIEMFQELNALILTDVGYNIKAMMQIVKALDATELPEILSVLKLKNADATDVAKLYESLKGKEDLFNPFGETKKGLKITQDTRVIAEPRTNSLIIMGPKDAVQRLEKFVTEHVDKTLKNQPSKLHSHKLHYVPAEQIATILNEVTKFGAESDAGKFGGIREGEKYLNRMHFGADKDGNNLIIRGDKEDYETIKDVINQLDQMQEQVAVEVLVVAINLTKSKGTGSQIRNKNPGKLNFQTSGFGLPPLGTGAQPIQVNPTANTIAANLINLAQVASSGTALLTLGKVDVWAILGLISETQEIDIIANPFLVVTNKYTSVVSVGESRRVPIGTVQGGTSPTTNEFGDIEANLKVTVTPQISRYNIINLDVDVVFDNFDTPLATANASPNSLSNADKTERRLHTNSNLGDREVLAIGGIIRTDDTIVETKVPILSSIPIIGTIFKNKSVVGIKQNLLVFISPRKIKAHRENITAYTKNKASIVSEQLYDINKTYNQRDPINRWFFKEQEFTDRNIDVVSEFVPIKEQMEAQNGTEIKKTKPKTCNSVLMNSVKKGCQ